MGVFNPTVGMIKNPTYILYGELFQKLQLVKVWKNSRYFGVKLVEWDYQVLKFWKMRVSSAY